MVMLKTSSLALLSALLVIGASAASFTFEVDSGSDASKPKDATFACAAHYTTLDYAPQVNVTTCHHEGAVKGWYHRINLWSDGHGMFTNTFYVAPPRSSSTTSSSKNVGYSKNAVAAAGGSECEVVGRPKPELTARGVREMLADTINTKTNCNAAIQCYDVKQVDEKCYPKDGDEEDEVVVKE